MEKLDIALTLFACLCLGIQIALNTRAIHSDKGSSTLLKVSNAVYTLSVIALLSLIILSTEVPHG